MKAAETPKEKPRLLHICQRESVFRGVLQAGNSCCRSQRNRNVAAASYSWWSLPQTWWHVLREEQLFTLPSNSKPWRRSNYCYRNTRHPVDIARVRILCILCAISGIFFPPHQNTPSINNWSIFHTTRFLSCWNQNPVPCKWPSMDPAHFNCWRKQFIPFYCVHVAPLRNLPANSKTEIGKIRPFQRKKKRDSNY